MQHHSYEELVAATLVPLGEKRHQLLAYPKLRPNSHGIVVQVGVEKVSWTWPTLSGEDGGLSAAGYWLPIQGAARRNEGIVSKHTASHQFCEIANQGGGVDMPRHGSLRLWFSLPF